MAYINRTPKEIAEVVEKLTAVKNSLPVTNFFGENNHIKYDNMIAVVQGRLSEDEIAAMENPEIDEDGDIMDEPLDSLTIGDLYTLHDWLHNDSVDISDMLEL